MKLFHGASAFFSLETFVSFGVDNSSSRHSEKFTNNLLVFGEKPTDGINDNVDKSGKKLILITLQR